MVDRIIRAIKGDVSLYEEAENNPGLQSEAFTIVAIVAVLAALGAAIGASFDSLPETNPIGSGLFSLISTFVGYLIWAYLTYFIGTSVFKGTANPGELLRTLGYSMSPQLVGGLFNVIPLLGPCIALLFSLWSLYLGIVAVRQALDFDTGKAVMTAGLAFIAQLVIFAMIGSILGLGALAAGAVTGG